MIAQPYPGLRPFNRDEDEIFFGRETHVNQLLDKLADAHFIAVLGTSGSGKSSLVRAGLLPALDGGFMAGVFGRWDVAELRPGDKPFRRLAAALVKKTAWGRSCTAGEQDSSSAKHQDERPSSDPDQAMAILEKDLRRGSLALNWRLGVRSLPENTRLLILVDQFEELFRYAETAGIEASAFVALILAAATHPRVYVVITMRSEYMGDCARFPGLPEAINTGLFLTPRLSPEQMADAIQLPARLYGGEVTADLANRLLKEARGEMDQLPLLQHALMRLWHRKTKEGQLTLTELEELGGLHKALNDHAEEAFNELDAAQKRIAAIMFRALTERGPAERDTRRPVPLAEIQELAQVAPKALDQVVDAFRKGNRNFLNTAAQTLDISHEALIRQWKRLHEWTADEFKQAELFQRLEASARRWRDDVGALWIDPDLQYALDWRDERTPNPRWAKRYGGDFKLAMRFLDASREERHNREMRREERRLKELKRSKRLAIAAMVALVITLGLAGWAVHEKNKAAQAEFMLLKHELISTTNANNLFSSNITLASLLVQVNNPAEALEMLRKTINLDTFIHNKYRQRSRNLLAGYVDIMGGAADRIYAGAKAALQDVAVSPDGRLLAASGERGTLVLFDPESGAVQKRLSGHDATAADFGSVNAIVFHLAGDTLYSGGDERRIISWSMPAGKRQAEWETPKAVWALALSPDGQNPGQRGAG